MSEELLFANALKASKAFNLIKNDFFLGLGNAYLIVSEDDEAVQSFFRLIACAVFCQQKHDVCLECESCMQVLHYNHPDVRFFNQEKVSITAANMRAMIEEAYIKPHTSHLLIFIERFDLTQDRIMNFLLKTLEEPPAGVSIFLGVANESKVLNTIKSRCRKVYLDVFDDEVIMEELQALNIPQEDAELATACAEGQLGKAKRIAQSETYKEIYNDVSTLLKKLLRSTDMMYYSGILDKYKNNKMEVLNIMSIILRDVMLYRTDPDFIKDGPIKDNVKEIAASFSEMAAKQCIESINIAKAKISSPAANPIAVMDSLLYSILEAKHKWQI